MSFRLRCRLKPGRSCCGSGENWTARDCARVKIADRETLLRAALGDEFG